MIPLKFYRDDNYVYYNNPNGITKKMTIADFESLMSNESELPEYSSSSQGKVLSVDSDGDLEWASLPPDELPEYSSSNQGDVLSVDSDGDLEWASLPPSGIPTYQSTDAGKVLAVNSGGTGTEWIGISEIFIVEVSDTDGGMVCNKSYTEIHQAMLDGKIVFAVNPTEGNSYQFFGVVLESYYGTGPEAKYMVPILQLSEYGLNKLVFKTDTASGYPSWTF